jgi:hypothetical protein
MFANVPTAIFKDSTSGFVRIILMEWMTWQPIKTLMSSLVCDTLKKHATILHNMSWSPMQDKAFNVERPD